MNSLFLKRSFWGSLLILVGILWLVENVFDLDIPIFRILFSLTLIIIGFALIKGWRFSKMEGTQTLFGDNRHTFSDTEKAHSVLFGEAHIDLTSMDLSTEKIVDLRCVFGEMRVMVPYGKNVSIDAEVSFGSIQMPDGNTTSFGGLAYRSPLISGEDGGLKIKISCTFGNVVIIHS